MRDEKNDKKDNGFPWGAFLTSILIGVLIFLGLLGIVTHPLLGGSGF